LFGWIYRREYRIPALWWIAGAAVTVLAYMPWLMSGIIQAAAHSPKTFSGKAAFWSVGGSTFFTAMNFFNNGKPTGLLDTSPLWTFVVGGLLFTAPVVIALWVSRGKERRYAVLAAMLWALPVLGAIAAGLLAHFQYNVRYVAFCAAPYYILAARGLALLKPATLRTVAVVLLLAYSANSLRANYFIPRKEGFRTAGAYVNTVSQPGDCGAFLPGFDVPLQFAIEHPQTRIGRILSRDELASGSPGCGRVWAVSWSVSGNPWQWAKAATDRQLLEASHQKVSEKRFFWIDVALYSRKNQ
jgi:hypothetical protein